MVEETQDEAKDLKVELQDQLVQTRNSITVGGQTIHYTVTTGTLVLREEMEKRGASEGEKAKALIFFIAYTRDDLEDRAQRPLTFSFNGGPGSSSVWLHLGLLGPRRAILTDIGDQPPPPYNLTDNEFSLLDVSDLVFIDPVGTGYSRAVSGEKPKAFYNFKKDIESVGAFIRLYTTRYERWLSPKFLIGESYGTTRAAALSGHLQERHGLYLNGIMLVSSILDFSTADFTVGNDLPYILFLPTFTATAWYHKKLSTDMQKDLQKALREAERFAIGPYAQALMQGDSLQGKERAKILQKLVRFTGLSPDFIDRADLRCSDSKFTKELLRNERRTVGRLDSRFRGIDCDHNGAATEHDPSFGNIIGPYTATLYDYIRRELKFESDLHYEIFSPKVNAAWSFAEHQNQFVNVANTLRHAMSINPYLKVFVANGYYDLATPYFATQYTFNHLKLDPSLRANVRMENYEAGHMMYIHLPSLQKQKADLADFIADSF